MIIFLFKNNCVNLFENVSLDFYNYISEVWFKVKFEHSIIKQMKEAFLHFVWRTKRFDIQNLVLTNGERLSVFSFGNYNQNEGPDFLNCQIEIGGTRWYGDIEIHVKSSDWTAHQHQTNPKYESVVLHVVYESDSIIERNDGSYIPCLELKNRIHPNLHQKYVQLENKLNWVPCQHFISSIRPEKVKLWLDRCLVERLESRTTYFNRLLKECNNNWEFAFWVAMARCFGYKINAMPFESIALTIPWKFLSSNKKDLLKIQALLFGQAGLLEKPFQDDYPKLLKNTYLTLQKEFTLQPIPVNFWKWSRLRPQNFPTIRIAQFAQLFFNNKDLLQKCLEATSIAELKNLFKVKIGGYWEDHYRFDQLSKANPKNLGVKTIELIILNVIAPFTFYFGQIMGRESLKDKALFWLDHLKEEQNHIVTNWKELGLSIDSAYYSQAAIQLKTNYCDQSQCLSCGIGGEIIKV